MQPRGKKILPFALLTLSMIVASACKSSAPVSNAPGTSPSPASSVVTTAPAAGPTAVTVAGAASGAMGAANCGNCWAHLYDDKNYKETDDHLMLCGPGKWPNMRALPGAIKPEWGDEIESIKVGPAATVTVWTGENYTGATQTYGPGKEIPNFLGSPAMKDSISSIEIKCQ